MHNGSLTFVNILHFDAAQHAAKIADFSITAKGC